MTLDRNAAIATNAPDGGAPDRAAPRDRKAECLAALIAGKMKRRVREALVVGCGSGIEAAILAQRLEASVIGIDLNEAFDPEAARFAALQRGDACNLEFEDNRFDLVYSYHALEHIPDYRRALHEMRRVLRVGGWYCVGTPNRSRLIGYLGSSGVSVATKLRWNLQDWRARLSGRFTNDQGAHAGFTASELARDLTTVFGEAQSITADYYLAVYRRFALPIGMLSVSQLYRLLFPSIYFMGRKPDGARAAQYG